MTKEQLQELIEQKGTVYDIDGFEIELYSKDKCHILPKYDKKNDYLLVHYANAFRYFLVSQLIDKEHYEWRQKTVAERTERFEPPMWNDIKERYCFAFNENFGKYAVCYTLDVDKRLDEDWAITIDRAGDIIYKGYATKENYEKACEMVRDLFNGGSNGKNA